MLGGLAWVIQLITTPIEHTMLDLFERDRKILSKNETICEMLQVTLIRTFSSDLRGRSIRTLTMTSRCQRIRSDSECAGISAQRRLRNWRRATVMRIRHLPGKGCQDVRILLDRVVYPSIETKLRHLWILADNGVSINDPHYEMPRNETFPVEMTRRHNTGVTLMPRRGAMKRWSHTSRAIESVCDSNVRYLVLGVSYHEIDVRGLVAGHCVTEVSAG